MFNELQIQQVFYSENPVNIDWVKEKVFRNICEQWPNQIQNVSKFRSGILPLSIETERFQNIPREFRLCTMCNDNVIEDETHFIFYCNQYNDLQEYLY